MVRDNTREIPLPSRFLARFTGFAKDIWKYVDVFRHDQEAHGETWDRRVFIPFNDWFKFIDVYYKHIRDPSLRTLVAKHLASLSAWRPTQDIIRFDNDLYSSLVKTSLTGKMPAEILQRLPAWGIYIESPALQIFGKSVEGFFVNLETCYDPNIILLDINYIDNALDSNQVFLPIGDWSVQQAIDKWNADFSEASQRVNGSVNEKSLLKMDDGLVQSLNLLIYVCSYGFWGAASNEPGLVTQTRAAPRKVKGIWRFFPPDKPTIRKIGDEFGELIRKYNKARQQEASEHHASPRPHIRRAHWHGYWQGPIKKESEKPRQFNVRWLPPIPVGKIDEDENSENEQTQI